MYIPVYQASGEPTVYILSGASHLLYIVAVCQVSGEPTACVHSIWCYNISCGCDMYNIFSALTLVCFQPA